MNIIKFIKDLIAPKKCYSCQKEGHFLCEDCHNRLPGYESLCYVCKGQTHNYEIHEGCKLGIYFDSVIIFAHYRQKLVKKMIKDFKFYHKKDIGEDLGGYMGILFLDHQNIRENNEYVIVPAPMFIFRKWMRGYNHSEILAHYISQSIGIPTSDAIKKIKSTPQQSKKSKEERIKNLIGSFSLSQKYIEKIKGKKVILVDDVVSTGSTINEISKVLKENGATEIIALVIASD